MENDDSVEKNMVDFSDAVENFRQNGMAVLPIKVDPSFVKKSKDICFSSWQDASKTPKLVHGHQLNRDTKKGFRGIVSRTPGRYDMRCVVNSEIHYLDEKSVLDKFMPFVYNILGKNLFNI